MHAVRRHPAAHRAAADWAWGREEAAARRVVAAARDAARAREDTAARGASRSSEDRRRRVGLAAGGVATAPCQESDLVVLLLHASSSCRQRLESGDRLLLLLLGGLDGRLLLKLVLNARTDEAHLETRIEAFVRVGEGSGRTLAADDGAARGHTQALLEVADGDGTLVNRVLHVGECVGALHATAVVLLRRLATLAGLIVHLAGYVVVQSIMRVLKRPSEAPLVVAGVVSVRGIFRLAQLLLRVHLVIHLDGHSATNGARLLGWLLVDVWRQHRRSQHRRLALDGELVDRVTGAALHLKRRLVARRDRDLVCDAAGRTLHQPVHHLMQMKQILHQLRLCGYLRTLQP